MGNSAKLEIQSEPMDQKCNDEAELYSTHVTAVNECTRFGSAA
jgi:hypothetical protein